MTRSPPLRYSSGATLAFADQFRGVAAGHAGNGGRQGRCGDRFTAAKVVLAATIVTDDPQDAPFGIHDYNGVSARILADPAEIFDRFTGVVPL
jgi:hypothetical protein